MASGLPAKCDKGRDGVRASQLWSSRVFLQRWSPRLVSGPRPQHASGMCGHSATVVPPYKLLEAREEIWIEEQLHGIAVVRLWTRLNLDHMQDTHTPLPGNFFIKVCERTQDPRESPCVVCLELPCEDAE